MTAIINFIKQHEKIWLGTSLTVLGAYLLYRNSSKPEKKNILEVSLKELIKRGKHPQVRKIVITSNPDYQGNFRRNLVSYVKERLMEENIKVLINCSPQKLLKAGCECYLESMESDDSDYEKYYQNALKAQFLIEDTIVSIETINKKENLQPIFMICDNNPMDIRQMNESDVLWTQTLQKNEILEQQITECYDIIIHVIEESQEEIKEDERISKFWEGHPQYHQIKAKEGQLRQKYEEVFGIIMRYLSQEKEKGSF